MQSTTVLTISYTYCCFSYCLCFRLQLGLLLVRLCMLSVIGRLFGICSILVTVRVVVFGRGLRGDGRHVLVTVASFATENAPQSKYTIARVKILFVAKSSASLVSTTNTTLVTVTVIVIVVPYRTYRVAQKTGPSYLIANILKTHDRIAWKSVNFCNIIMLHTVINFLFKNFIALWRHPAKTQLLCDAQIYLYNVNK